MAKVYVSHKDLMTVMKFTKALTDVPDTAHAAFFRIGAAITRGEKTDDKVMVRYAGDKLKCIKALRELILDMTLIDAKQVYENGYWEAIRKDMLPKARKIAKAHAIELVIDG